MPDGQAVTWVLYQAAVVKAFNLPVETERTKSCTIQVAEMTFLRWLSLRDRVKSSDIQSRTVAPSCC